jgi:hypothetical protein
MPSAEFGIWKLEIGNLEIGYEKGDGQVKYVVTAKRAMQCGECMVEPGGHIATIEYAHDVPAEFVAHAIGSDLVACERDNAPTTGVEGGYTPPVRVADDTVDEGAEQ